MKKRVGMALFLGALGLAAWAVAVPISTPVHAQESCPVITGTVLIASPALTVTDGMSYTLLQDTRLVSWSDYWNAIVVEAEINYSTNYDGLEATLGSLVEAHWQFEGLEAQDYVLYVEVVEPLGPYSYLDVDIGEDTVIEIVTGTDILNLGSVYSATVNGSTLDEGNLFIRFSVEPSYGELELAGVWLIALRNVGCPWPDDDLGPLPTPTPFPTATPIPTLTPFPTMTLPPPVKIGEGFSDTFTTTFGVLTSHGALPDFGVDSSQWLFSARKWVQFINQGNLLWVMCAVLLAGMVLGWALDQIRNPR